MLHRSRKNQPMHDRSIRMIYRSERFDAKFKTTAPGIPVRSPITVLTGPFRNSLHRSDGIWCVDGGMAVAEENREDGGENEREGEKRKTMLTTQT